MQVAARLAGCRHCLCKVPRGAPRFGFAYSLQKFHSYLHEACVIDHLVQEQSNMEQAAAFLATTIQDEKLKAEVRAAAERLQRDLSRHLATSSGCGSST